MCFSSFLRFPPPFFVQPPSTHTLSPYLRFLPDASSVQSSCQSCLLESPDLRPVKQRARQPNPLLLLPLLPQLPLLTFRPYHLPPHPPASEKGLLQTRARLCHLGLQVDGPRDRRSPKPFLPPPPPTLIHPRPGLGEGGRQLQIWIVQSKSEWHQVVYRAYNLTFFFFFSNEHSGPANPTEPSIPSGSSSRKSSRSKKPTGTSQGLYRPRRFGGYFRFRNLPLSRASIRRDSLDTEVEAKSR